MPDVIFTKDFLAKNELYEIGDRTYGKPIVNQYGNDGKLKIGKYSSIAPNVEIFLGGNHRIDWCTTYPFTAKELADLYQEGKNILGHPATKGDVVIGSDVWIGSGATILSGVKIGDGSVVAAKAVVTKSFGPYSVIAGNPARLVKRRFTKRQIKQLIKIAWWDWTDKKIKENIKFLCSDNINYFISQNKKSYFKNLGIIYRESGLVGVIRKILFVIRRSIH